MTIICNDPPYPTIHGGRMDMWNRIKGFYRLGVKLQLVYWYEKTRPSENDKRVMSEVADSIVELHRTMRVTDLLHYRYPPRMKSCHLGGADYESFVQTVSAFNPEVIWLDLWYGYLTAKKLSHDLHIPLVYRSQNVEYKYLQQLFDDATGLFKLKLFLNLIRMKKAEREVRTLSNLVYDISPADNNAWKSDPLQSQAKVLLPTFIPPPELSSGEELQTAADIDVLFVGNLSNPSNISGIKWFAAEVLDNIKAHYADIRIIVAGSNPSADLLALCHRHSITCLPDPETVFDFYGRAKTIINPQLKGSGISLKMVELLLTSRPVVTTTVGVRGLPDEVIADFHVADTAADFTAEILNCLTGKTSVNSVQRVAHLQRYFGLDPLEAILGEIDVLTSNGQ